MNLAVMANNKNNIALQFPDMRLLWNFAQQIACKNIEINTNTKVLVGNCTEKEINLAITTCSAKILEGSVTKTTA